MLKTVTFALVHVTVAFSVVYAMTGSAVAGGGVALVGPTFNTVAYHFHEKVWAWIRQRRGMIEADRSILACSEIKACPQQSA